MPVGIVASISFLVPDQTGRAIHIEATAKVVTLDKLALFTMGEIKRWCIGRVAGAILITGVAVAINIRAADGIQTITILVNFITHNLFGIGIDVSVGIITILLANTKMPNPVR